MKNNNGNKHNVWTTHGLKKRIYSLLDVSQNFNLNVRFFFQTMRSPCDMFVAAVVYFISCQIEMAKEQECLWS